MTDEVGKIGLKSGLADYVKKSQKKKRTSARDLRTRTQIRKRKKRLKPETSLTRKQETSKKGTNKTGNK